MMIRLRRKKTLGRKGTMNDFTQNSGSCHHNFYKWFSCLTDSCRWFMSFPTMSCPAFQEGCNKSMKNNWFTQQQLNMTLVINLQISVFTLQDVGKIKNREKININWHKPCDTLEVLHKHAIELEDHLGDWINLDWANPIECRVFLKPLLLHCIWANLERKGYTPLLFFENEIP